MRVVRHGSSRGSEKVRDLFPQRELPVGFCCVRQAGSGFTKRGLKSSLKVGRLRGHADSYQTKEVRDGRTKWNPYNLTFLFKSLISNVFPTHFFCPELLASSKIAWVGIPTTFGCPTVRHQNGKWQKAKRRRHSTRFFPSQTTKGYKIWLFF